MKKMKIAALLMAALIAAVSAAGCNKHKKDPAISNSTNNPNKTYSEIEGVAEIEHNVSMNEDADVNNTQYKLNRVIDSGVVKDGKKFIYADITIKNTSDVEYEITAINNFYVSLPDGSEIASQPNTQVYAINHLNGYEKISSVGAGEEFNGYIGFALDTSVTDFTICFFPTGKDYNDKKDVVRTEISAADVIPAPEGMFTPEE
ncbi:MAG: DUF4352 domain-containing protein [Acutalibacteraceae bacterium]|nr:DUF4352 domain-containing protein [Oscillospiraceae bacterium]